jgi:hypothetical protein
VWSGTEIQRITAASASPPQSAAHPREAADRVWHFLTPPPTLWAHFHFLVATYGHMVIQNCIKRHALRGHSDWICGPDIERIINLHLVDPATHRFTIWLVLHACWIRIQNSKSIYHHFKFLLLVGSRSKIGFSLWLFTSSTKQRTSRASARKLESRKNGFKWKAEKIFF